MVDTLDNIISAYDKLDDMSKVKFLSHLIYEVTVSSREIQFETSPDKAIQFYQELNEITHTLSSEVQSMLKKISGYPSNVLISMIIGRTSFKPVNKVLNTYFNALSKIDP